MCYDHIPHADTDFLQNTEIYYALLALARLSLSRAFGCFTRTFPAKTATRNLFFFFLIESDR